jgi:hypothetical protein
VRKVSFGVGVERTFPVHSPTIAKIEVATLGDVRRAKLYYLRERHGKAAKIKERRVPRGKAAANEVVVDASADDDDLDEVEEIEMADEVESTGGGADEVAADA